MLTQTNRKLFSYFASPAFRFERVEETRMHVLRCGSANIKIMGSMEMRLDYNIAGAFRFGKCGRGA